MADSTQYREQLPGPPRREAGMVTGVKGGGLLFYSALRGRGDTIQEQARSCFDNLKDLLGQAGASLNNVAKVTVYFQDVGERQAFDEVWREVFPENAPARTGVGVAQASPNPDGPFRFAIDVIAIAP